MKSWKEMAEKTGLSEDQLQKNRSYYSKGQLFSS